MSVEEAALVIEALTGVPPMLLRRTRKTRQEQTARLRRFLALPPELQEGALRYAENIQASYCGQARSKCKQPGA